MSTVVGINATYNTVGIPQTVNYTEGETVVNLGTFSIDMLTNYGIGVDFVFTIPTLQVGLYELLSSSSVLPITESPAGTYTISGIPASGHPGDVAAALADLNTMIASLRLEIDPGEIYQGSFVCTAAFNLQDGRSTSGNVNVDAVALPGNVANVPQSNTITEDKQDWSFGVNGQGWPQVVDDLGPNSGRTYEVTFAPGTGHSNYAFSGSATGTTATFTGNQTDVNADIRGLLLSLDADEDGAFTIQYTQNVTAGPGAPISPQESGSLSFTITADSENTGLPTVVTPNSFGRISLHNLTQITDNRATELPDTQYQVVYSVSDSSGFFTNVTGLNGIYDNAAPADASDPSLPNRFFPLAVSFTDDHQFMFVGYRITDSPSYRFIVMEETSPGSKLYVEVEEVENNSLIGPGPDFKISGDGTRLFFRIGGTFIAHYTFNRTTKVSTFVNAFDVGNDGIRPSIAVNTDASLIAVSSGDIFRRTGDIYAVVETIPDATLSSEQTITISGDGSTIIGNSIYTNPNPASSDVWTVLRAIPQTNVYTHQSAISPDGIYYYSNQNQDIRRIDTDAVFLSLRTHQNSSSRPKGEFGATTDEFAYIPSFTAPPNAGSIYYYTDLTSTQTEEVLLTGHGGEINGNLSGETFVLAQGYITFPAAQTGIVGQVVDLYEHQTVVEFGQTYTITGDATTVNLALATDAISLFPGTNTVINYTQTQTTDGVVQVNTDIDII